MLKPIIQEKNIDALLRFEPMPLREAVPADTKRHAILQAEFHQLDFITSSVYAAVATTQYPNARAASNTIQNRKRPEKHSQRLWSVHHRPPSRHTAISAAARSVAPRELATNWRAASLIFFMRSGLRNNSIQATPSSSGLST